MSLQLKEQELQNLTKTWKNVISFNKTHFVSSSQKLPIIHLLWMDASAKQSEYIQIQSKVSCCMDEN